MAVLPCLSLFRGQQTKLALALLLALIFTLSPNLPAGAKPSSANPATANPADSDLPASDPTTPAPATSGASLELLAHPALNPLDLAEDLAGNLAWLKGLNQAAEDLALWPSLALSGLSLLELQALASQLDLCRVEIYQKEALPPQAGKILAFYQLRQAQPAEVNQALAALEARELHLEVLAEYWRLAPQTVALARSCEILPPQNSPENLLTQPQNSEGPDSKARTFRSVRRRSRPNLPAQGQLLQENILKMRALASYRQMLSPLSPAWAEPQSQLKQINKALESWTDCPPLLISQAEILLDLGRPSAALRSLSPLDLLTLAERKDLAQSESDQEEPGQNEAGQSALSADNFYALADLGLQLRFLRVRAKAQASLDQRALARLDLDRALALAPDKGEFWLLRGALRQLQGEEAGSCADYTQACVLGYCAGLGLAREEGLCLERR